MSNLLKQLNSNIRALDEELSDFEVMFIREENGEVEMIEIYIEPQPAYHGHNFYIEVNVNGENTWTRKWHDRFCKQFDCILDNIRKESIKTSNNYGDGFKEKWTYTYKPLEWKGFQDMHYDDLAVVDFRREYSWETVRLDMSLNRDYVDSLCVSSSFYTALKECSPNNTTVMLTEENYNKLHEAARNDRETGFIQFASVGDMLRFKKWKR